MLLAELTPVQISAGVAILCFVAAILFMAMVAKHSQTGNTETPVSFFKRMLNDANLSEAGMRYRIAMFIALMFTFMNLVGTVVIYLAAQTPA